MLNRFGYELYLKDIPEGFTKYPWIERAYIKKQERKVSQSKDSNLDFYGIGVVHGAAVREDGIPELHTRNRIGGLCDLFFDSWINRGIIAGNKKESRTILEYTIKKVGIPREYLYLEDNGATTLVSMHNVKRRVDKWKNDGEIPSNPTVYWITQNWAKERTEIVADCVLKDYSHVVYDVYDSRDESLVSADAAKEAKNLEIDGFACRIYNYIHRPLISQILATGIKDFRNFPKYVKGRI